MLVVVLVECGFYSGEVVFAVFSWVFWHDYPFLEDVTVATSGVVQAVTTCRTTTTTVVVFYIIVFHVFVSAGCFTVFLTCLMV